MYTHTHLTHNSFSQNLIHHKNRLNISIFLVKYDLDMLFTGFLGFTLAYLPMTESKWPVTC